MVPPYAPLPGSGLPRRGLFVDRWGTLLRAPEAGWCKRFQPELLCQETLDALFRAGQEGWNLYLIGNEDQVAYGQQTRAEWEAFEADLVEHLRSYGVQVKRCYAGLDRPDGVKGHAKDSVYTLPNTGAMYHARQADGIELKHSWVVGDSTLELVAGWRSGCKLAGVRTGRALADGELQVEPDLTEDDLAAVLREITMGSFAPRP